MDISLGGCAIRGTIPVQRGDYLQLQIFPNASTAPILIGLAPVRWSNGELFGVEFITLSPSDTICLQTYVKAVESDISAEID